MYVSVTSLYWPIVCIRLTFLSLFDAKIVYRIFIVLVIRYFSWWSFMFLRTIFHCLCSPFSTSSRRFVIRARVSEDILDLSGLMIALATLVVLSWIRSYACYQLTFE